MLLEGFGPEIWTVEGRIVAFPGVPYPTRMAIVRLSDRTLFIGSPISLSDALRSEVDALGAVSQVVSPNKLHHIWLGEWMDAYSHARLYAPPGLRRKRRDLEFHGDLRDVPEPYWANDICQAAVAGKVFLP
jgi:hypothetical protein